MVHVKVLVLYDEELPDDCIPSMCVCVCVSYSESMWPSTNSKHLTSQSSQIQLFSLVLTKMKCSLTPSIFKEHIRKWKRKMLACKCSNGILSHLLQESGRISLDVGERVGKTIKDEVPDKMFHPRTYWPLSGCPVQQLCVDWLTEAPGAHRKLIILYHH